MDKLDKIVKILSVGITAIAFYKAIKEVFKEDKPKKVRKKIK